MQSCLTKTLKRFLSPTLGGDTVKGIFSFLGKRISPFDPQEKGIRIASEQLEELQCLPIALPIARQSRVGCCYTIWLASTTRCRSASLVGVQTNHRLPRHLSMPASASNAAFRTQSAAEGTSLAPHDSKARLRVVTTRRRFMAKPCTPHLHCAARAALRATNCQCKISLGGFKGGYSLLKESIPL